MSITTNFKDTDGVDLGDKLFSKGDLIDAYPSILNTYKSAGLWGWGYGIQGQLGNNAITDRSSPVQTISGGTNWKQVSSGYYHTAAIKTDGTLWVWGDNSAGQLGNNTIISRSSPVQTISGGTNWKQVYAGYGHTAAIKTDGTLWLWGFGTSGELGNNSTLSRSSPVQTISGGTNWKEVSCGEKFTAAIKTDGTLWLWGRGSSGQIGDNTITFRSSPVQTISGGNNWKQVSCGRNHTAAIKTDGTLWLWGFGTSGELGNNSTLSRSSPVQTISGGNNWKQVACGYFHTAAVKTDGTLWLWGSGVNGELGNNSTLSRSSPVQTISGGNNWKQVSCGFIIQGTSGHTAAIKTDGTLWLWGLGAEGQLGDNTIISKSSPVQTISGGTNWKQVSGGEKRTTAISEFEGW